MKGISTTLRTTVLIMVLMSCLYGQGWAVNANGAQVVVFDGNVVGVWATRDSDNNPIIQGAIGMTSTDPSTWSFTKISGENKTSQYSNPRIFSNGAGDVIALWQFPDAKGNHHLEGAALPAGSGTWTSHLFSTIDDNSNGFDQQASIDAFGNILVTWTSYNVTIGQTQVRGVTGTTSLGVVTFNPAFTLSR